VKRREIRSGIHWVELSVLGPPVGDEVGLFVVSPEPVGENVGDWVRRFGRRCSRRFLGSAVSNPVGPRVRVLVGDKVGSPLGAEIGDPVGEAVGSPNGEAVAEAVGDDK
jgi:hypothetical protein